MTDIAMIEELKQFVLEMERIDKLQELKQDSSITKLGKEMLTYYSTK